MLRLRNELNGNSELISPRSVGPHNNSISFVPFINERDSLGRLIGITPKRYDLKRDLMPRGGGSKKQLLSKIYQDSQTQESIHIESKMDDLESPSGMDFWRSEEILPRIKRSELSLGELKINKKPIKARAQNKDINSARDLPERTRIPPIGFYDVSSSLQLTKQKQRVAIIFEEHKKNRPTELEVIKESKDGKGDRSQNSNLTKSNSGSNPIYQIKSERYMRPIDNKANKGIAYKDSAASFVDKRSYFKRIKSREDEDMYSKYQQSMNHKFNEMREKLNMLKGSINQE